MTTKTATVEALTAEVRVLMVGSRQITMSVYDQLDTVRWDHITIPMGFMDFEGKCAYEIPPPPSHGEPFGRVRPRKAKDYSVYIVGSHVITGALVRSEVIDPHYLHRQRWNGRYRYNNEEPAGAPAEVRRISDPYMCDYDSDWSHLWPKKISWDDAYRYWNYFTDLPLIVLAGLR